MRRQGGRYDLILTRQIGLKNKKYMFNSMWSKEISNFYSNIPIIN